MEIVGGWRLRSKGKTDANKSVKVDSDHVDIDGEWEWSSWPPA